MIIAGETSGDERGGELVRELRKRNPDIRLFGIGGDTLASLGVELVFHTRDTAIMGFAEVVAHLPFIFRMFRTCKRLLREKKPDAVILIDYPGFNLRFARTVKKMGIPVIYYISPQVWAWGKHRVKKMADTIDLMLVLLPFEEEFYRKHGLRAKFVGHPVKDHINIKHSRDEFCSSYGLDPGKPILGLLPGSRAQEIKKLLPPMREAAHICKKRIPGLQVIMAQSPSLAQTLFSSSRVTGREIIPVTGKPHDVMAHADALLVASGTATLEAAIIKTPMVICYRLSRLTYFIGKMVVSVDAIGLANIVAGEKIVPELIQEKATPQNMAEYVVPLLTDTSKAETMKEGLALVARKLGQPGSAAHTAESILTFLANRE